MHRLVKGLRYGGCGQKVTCLSGHMNGKVCGKRLTAYLRGAQTVPRAQTVPLQNTDVCNRLTGKWFKKLFHSAMMDDKEACLFLPVAATGTWIKHWLHTPKRSLEEASHSDHWSSHTFCTRKRLVVALLVILALILMILLLLLNYYCIMVWHLCQEESAFPMFHNTTPNLENQD